MTTEDKITHWRFDHPDYPKIYASSQHLLDDEVYRLKCELNVPKWISIKIVPDHELSRPVPPTPAPASSLGHSHQQNPVPKRTRSRKLKQSSAELPVVQHLLDKSTDPLDLVPSVLRPKLASLRNTPSTGLDSGDDVQKDA